MVDIKPHLIKTEIRPGQFDVAPFILRLRLDMPEINKDGVHVPCWLEFHEGNDFDPEKAKTSKTPKLHPANNLANYRSLPKLDVKIGGEVEHTYRATCVRSEYDGEVGVIQCDDGVLWTILPKK